MYLAIFENFGLIFDQSNPPPCYAELHSQQCLQCPVSLLSPGPCLSARISVHPTRVGGQWGHEDQRGEVAVGLGPGLAPRSPDWSGLVAPSALRCLGVVCILQNQCMSSRSNLALPAAEETLPRCRAKRSVYNFFYRKLTLTGNTTCHLALLLA